MYAIIADGGRQYRVEEGQEVNVDYRDVPKGSQVTFDRVLAVSGADGVKLGSPLLTGAAVQAEVLGVQFAEKIYIQKFRRRKNYRRRTGHRQMLTRVKVQSITG
jgi:large subunit ribosomal protein L21